MDLRQLFDNPDHKIALSYSGGKDSSVLLDLCRPYKDRFTVVWVNTGYAFPHIQKHVVETTQDFSFQEIAHDLKPVWEQHGLPTHILPLDHAPMVSAKAKTPYLQNWVACCLRRMESVVKALEPQGFDILLTGQRATDASPSVPLRQVMNAGAITMVAPLWEWSDEEILDYISQRNISLPASATIDDTSMECTICPAQIEKRIDFIKEHYPEYLPTIGENVRAVMDVVQGRLDEMAKAG